ncbi:tetratricopeptide repeat protein [Limnoraphis robusta]|uniref:Tetratricopeptide repeat protein n=1 Tax=Limnoraphis robusta CCNP1315 TaxID=3110306 RepID=A0ABU5U0I5_9CYAN|nr:tetratricopeptide repeat protein [Limnoraphis robusta]MEA5501231.1 tetratricopeptide repeat protein [Limnoraphis robusta BA-68 BA1]MEA5520594.1 tetratricopeptide repeat protein [Limnoraphis robusta CCNP1315]MEA5548583.1 tetratricopeptide repeat protein [Limnoraphis robusta CCNP1324]
MQMIGQLLDRRYRIVQILSSGAFGQTYLAADTRRPGHPQCVVKQLRPPNNNSNILKTALRLFEKEAEILEKLGRHNQIPLLLAYFKEHNHFYLVEEYIEGHSLTKELVPGTPWPEERVIKLLEEILELLLFVHEQGVIHRDVNPSNIIRRRSDKKLVLIDFGSVKEVTHQFLNGNSQSMRTIATGTPSYMPIEQFQGNPQYSSDLYAVGMIAIQAVTGLEASDLPKLQDPNLSGPEDITWRNRARVSAGFAKIIDKMVHHYYGKRYPACIDVISDLRKLTGRSDFTYVPNSTPSNQAKPIKNWGKIAGVTATGLVGFLVIFGLIKVLNRPDPVKAQVAFTQGVDKLEKGNPKAAVKTLSQAIHYNPNNSEAYRQRGNAHYQLQEYPKAIEDYTEAIKLNPNYTNAYFNRGLARYETQDFSGAIADYSKVIELEPQDVDAYYKRGLAQYALENYQKAIEDYSAAIRLQSDNPLAYRSRGIARVDAGDLQGGLADYTEAIRLDPENILAYYDRGRTRFHLGDYQGALSDYDRAIELEPNNSAVYGNRCSTQINLSQHQAAIDDCTKAIELEPNAVAYNNRCVAYLNLQELDNGLADCTKAIELTPKDHKAYSNRGMVYVAKQDFVSAIADYTKAIELNPNDAQSYSNRAVAYYQLQDYNRAIADYVQAIRLKPDYATAYYGRGLVRVTLGDKSGAINDFQQAGQLYLEQGLTGGYRDAQYQIQQLK